MLGGGFGQEVEGQRSVSVGPSASFVILIRWNSFEFRHCTLTPLSWLAGTYSRLLVLKDLLGREVAEVPLQHYSPRKCIVLDPPCAG
jgi:hypothetical protein